MTRSASDVNQRGQHRVSRRRLIDLSITVVQFCLTARLDPELTENQDSKFLLARNQSYYQIC
jgi:hypothetical protein